MRRYTADVWFGPTGPAGTPTLELGGLRVSASQSIASGTLRHVGFTIERKRVRLYIDGQVSADMARPSGSPMPRLSRVVLGAPRGARFFKGALAGLLVRRPRAEPPAGTLVTASPVIRVWWPIVTVMLGMSDRSVIGVLLSSRSPGTATISGSGWPARRCSSCVA